MCESVPAQTLFAGKTSTLRPCFEDPEDEKLTLGAMSSDPEIVSVLVSELEVTLQAEFPGSTTITVTATDPAGQPATVEFEVTVLVPRLLREDFDHGLGDWKPHFGTIASASEGLVRFHNWQLGYFGIIGYDGVTAVHWELKAAVGNDTDSTVVGLHALNSGDPQVYWIAVGDGATLESVGDADYQLLVFGFGGWRAERSWWGESDAVAGVGELTELTLTARDGQLTALAGSTELVKVDMEARDWTPTMMTTRLATWPEESTTGIRGFADWVEIWGVDVSAEANWHEGPHDISELVTTGPRVEVGGAGIRRK